jgi:hypothetical protein
LPKDEAEAASSSWLNGKKVWHSTTVSPPTAPLEPKLKHWIRITVTGYPPWTVRLLPSTAIKDHINLGHSPNHSITSLFCFLPSQSTMLSELHRYHYSFSPLSYTHHPSTQWHSQWWISRPSFTFWITYRYVNSHRKIF